MANASHLTVLEFRNGSEILTLYPQEWIGETSYVLGWCPELENTIYVHEDNLVLDGDNDGA